jgi:hypothetical protein
MKEIYYSLIRRYSLLSSEHESVSVSHSRRLRIRSRLRPNVSQIGARIALDSVRE